ncbi:hypothetical protein DERP_010495 [Dermatophagoides pteronyssinus]|uniref:Uncharacterized protein n=1 Tax=Dermatophagoides pteronyssinus TaxID=6956 RepID=A0ABQ8JFI9_DERPT|nr:hypothetical protein DERP_010495 [Dermatophagoides pteronyssinus]
MRRLIRLSIIIELNFVIKEKPKIDGDGLDNVDDKIELGGIDLVATTGGTCLGVVTSFINNFLRALINCRSRSISRSFFEYLELDGDDGGNFAFLFNDDEVDVKQRSSFLFRLTVDIDFCVHFLGDKRCNLMINNSDECVSFFNSSVDSNNSLYARNSCRALSSDGIGFIASSIRDNASRILRCTVGDCSDCEQTTTSNISTGQVNVSLEELLEFMRSFSGII